MEANSAPKPNAGRRRESSFPDDLRCALSGNGWTIIAGLSSTDFRELWDRPSHSMKVSRNAVCRSHVVYFLKLSDDVVRERMTSRSDVLELRLGLQPEVS